MDFLSLGWSDVHLLTSKLAKKVESADVIVGILRGGMIPALLLSDLLGIKDVVAVRLGSYKGTQKLRKPYVTEPPCIDLRGKRILVVDDVCDTGETLEVVTKLLRLLGASGNTIAVLVKKSSCKVKVDLWGMEDDRWILFPWEANEILSERGEEVKPHVISMLGERVSRAVLGGSQDSR
jgi:hypoxanthine phosphoribosyltransferase